MALPGLSILNCPQYSIMCWSAQNVKGTRSAIDKTRKGGRVFFSALRDQVEQPRDGFSPAVCGGDMKLCGVEGDSQSTRDRLVGGYRLPLLQALRAREALAVPGLRYRCQEIHHRLRSESLCKKLLDKSDRRLESSNLNNVMNKIEALCSAFD
jgi:hypothetical protein